MTMTYREFSEQVNAMSEEQKNATVTIYVTGTDEFYSVVSDYPLRFVDSSNQDTLDSDHPYLVI